MSLDSVVKDKKKRAAVGTGHLSHLDGVGGKSRDRRAQSWARSSETAKRSKESASELSVPSDRGRKELSLF